MQITEKHKVGFSFSFVGGRWQGLEGKLTFLSLYVSFQGCVHFSSTFRSRVKKGYPTLRKNRSLKSLRRRYSIKVKMKVPCCFLLDKDECFYPLICQTQLENVSFNFPAGGKKNTFGLRQSSGNFRLIEVLE